MIYPEIKNATVHCGHTTFVHADIQDQSDETLRELGKGKVNKNTNGFEYSINPDVIVFLWNRNETTGEI